VISQAAEYALRAAVCLAQNPAAPLTIERIARDARVPAGYLAKVMQLLVRARLVTSQRGINGGFLLAASTGELTLLRIVSAVDPSRRIGACPLGLHHPGDVLCPLHRRLDEAAAKVEEILASTTVSELITDTSGVKPLCGDACPHRTANHDDSKQKEKVTA
jgi:Rrf2 family protein